MQNVLKVQSHEINKVFNSTSSFRCVSKSKDKCEDCKFWEGTSHAGDSGYCWYKNKPMPPKIPKCKKFEEMTFDDFAAGGTEFSHGRSYSFAGMKKREEKELRDLIIRIMEVGLIATLVLVTIYFGIQSL